MRDGQKCRGGNRGTGKYGIRLPYGVEMQDWKVYEQYARVENAGLKNAPSIAGGKKCGTIEYGKLVCEEECQS